LPDRIDMGVSNRKNIESGFVFFVLIHNILG
jgi:hypothetical protein